MTPIHDRMPAILSKSAFGLWLDPEIKDLLRLLSLPVPFSAEEIEAYQVGTPVDNPGDDVGASGRRHRAWPGISGLAPPPSWRANPGG